MNPVHHGAREQPRHVIIFSSVAFGTLISFVIQDNPLRKWRDNDRDAFLQELIRLDGRGDSAVAATCGLCQEVEPSVRCEDCFGGLMFCRRCTVDLHACNPLHRIEVCGSPKILSLHLPSAQNV